MKPNLATRMTRNNFDLVRFVLSLIVCFVHCSQLSGVAQLAFVPVVLSSSMAVQGFFVVSGFLVFMSFDKSRGLSTYFQKRVRRLYPGYVVVVLGFSVALVLVSTTTTTNYFDAAWLKYVGWNLVFLNFVHPELPGVFLGNPVSAVNGALWSLKIEVSFYLSVPVIAYLFRFQRVAVMGGVYLLSILWSTWMHALALQRGGIYEELGRQLPGALAFFISGAAVYYYRELFERHIAWLLPLAAIVLVVDKFVVLTLLYPAALAIVVCFAALFCYAGNFGRFGDFSYGLYIVHFPILQILVSKGLFAWNPWVGVVVEVALALLASVLLWNLVEKRFLFRSSHYVLATVAPVQPEAAPSEEGG